jgi:ribosome-associated protein
MDYTDYLYSCSLKDLRREAKEYKDIVSLDLRKISSSVSDYFIICHADSSTQVRAIADSVEHEMDKVLNEHLWHKEGQGNAEWILLDYVSVVVHIFKTDKREFYGVEELWGDAQSQRFESAS